MMTMTTNPTLMNWTVLDDFKPKPTPAPAQPDAAQAPSADDFDEEAFLRQLEQDMANMMGGASNDPTGSSAAQADPEFLDQDAETFAKYLEESGVTPSDFLKQLVGDVMMKGEDGDDSTTAATAGSSSSAAPPPAAAAAAAATPAGGNNAAPETFNDTIQRTIERMKESGDKATAAASEDDVSDDLVAQLIKAIEAGAGDGDEGDLTKMFMGMMEQLSNKEILYEPMKELDTKFGPWIAENKGKGKVSDEDMARYEKQAGVVALIVTKFEEKGYSDEDPKCREYVWEKMQEMQAAGNPPDELISAPWMEDLKGPGGAGGAPECPQQ
ncbi:Pex19 protein [Aspergillus sclerotioniger CBS 115572]|uniref:Pex19 protein n=1 Tax=Aspergillus sclerotioniger CBS 115572 TaxID=1450535 RepID=A0A317WE66_9EURO|nr:Pex19 protein [Aspergillus sclerotioniger CBS 115572]PWY84579.1 Pex19 protein [Aspergillus sclerotioniger CBS 115572]